MKINKRQFSILFVLLSADNPVKYTDLLAYFSVTEKTIKNDIDAINGVFDKNELFIDFEKNKGFNVKGNSKYINDLKDKIFLQFKNHNSIFYINDESLLLAMNFILSVNGYFKLNDIAILLSSNIRSATEIMKEIRAIFSKYNLVVMNVPHYGMKVIGKERDIRKCITENLEKSVYFLKEFSNFEAEKYLNLDNRAIIEKHCLNYIKEYRINIDELSLRKLVCYILVANSRIKNFHFITLNKLEQLEITNYFESVHVESLIKNIERDCNIKYPKEEELWLKAFIIFHLDYFCDEVKSSFRFSPKIVLGYQKLCDEVKYLFNQIGIKSDYGSLLEYLKPLLLKYTIRSQYYFYENCNNSEMIHLVNKSPFICDIGNLVYNVIKKEVMYNLGDMFLNEVVMAIYTYVRGINNLIKKVSIAIYTPFNSQSGNSLRRRILDRFSDVINKIDVITLKNLVSFNEEEYDYLIRFEKNQIDTLNPNIKQLLFDYYFIESDVSSFYEYIYIPARTYRNSFAKQSVENFIFTDNLKSFNELKIYLKTFITDERVLNQLDKITILPSMVYNNTYNLILYTSQRGDTVSKIIILDKKYKYNGFNINRIFFNVLNLGFDTLALKTTEKVLRNLTTLASTDNEIIKEKYDFYEYYVNNELIKL